MTKDEEEVLRANESFYAAFASRDLGAMDSLWARESPVACLHPGWNLLSGRDEVMRSWRGILFVSEGGAWRMAHHHASPVPPPAASGGLPN